MTHEDVEDVKTFSKRCSCLLTAFGWLFDFFLVAVNIGDVVSDFLILIQFANDGQFVFFYLVLTSLIIANIIYTIFGVELLLRETLGINFWRPLEYLVVFLFAQLVPVVQWLKEQIRPTESSVLAAAKTQWTGRVIEAVRQEGTAVSVEELNSMVGTATVMERLDAALSRHMHSHAMFYVECVVEAIPQAVIQLIAVSYMGEATTLQIFSIALSMISIVSKGYVFSQSLAIPEMIWKFFIGVHDVFSLFYIFSSLISKNSSPDVTVTDSLSVDYMVAAWVLKLSIPWGVLALIGVAFLIVRIIIHIQSPGTTNITLKNVGEAALITFCGILCAVPAVIAAEGAKLLWGLLAIASFEPVRAWFPSMAQFYNFYNRAESSKEAHRRIQYICSRYVEFEERFVRHKNRMRAEKRTSGSDRKLPEKLDTMKTILSAKPFDPSRLYWDLRDPVKYGTVSGVEKLLVGSLCTVGLLYSLGQLYSLVFPFVHYPLQWVHGRNTALQGFYFFGTCGSLLIVLILAPRAARYIWLQLLFSYIYQNNSGFFVSEEPADPQADVVAAPPMYAMIQQYHVPPLETILRATLPEDRLVLTTTMTADIASFLEEKDLQMQRLTVAECAAWKEKANAHWMSIDLSGEDSRE